MIEYALKKIMLCAISMENNWVFANGNYVYDAISIYMQRPKLKAIESKLIFYEKFIINVFEEYLYMKLKD